MSLNASLSAALSGLQVNQSLMQISSANIANAGTADYSVKKAQLSSIVIDGQGRGVAIRDVERSVDNFLVREISYQTSKTAYYDSLAEYYTRTQDMFGTPDDNSSIAGMLNDLRVELEQLAIDPGQAVNQYSTVTSAIEVADEFNELSTEIQRMREEVNREILASVETINTKLYDIQKLNSDIARATALGDPTGEYLDKRDAALREMAELMDIKWYQQENGSTIVMTGSGYTLLDSKVHEMTFTAPTGVSAGTRYETGGFSPIGITDKIGDITTIVDSGRIAGLVELRDKVLTSLQGQLDQLATNFSEQINRAHNSTMPLNGKQNFVGNTQYTTADLLDASNPASIALTPYSNGATTSYGTLQFAIVDSTGAAVGQAMRVDLDEFVSEMEAYVTGVTGTPFTYQLTIGDVINMLNGAYAATPPAATPVPPAPAGWPGAVPWPPSPALVMTSTGSDIAGLTNMSGAGVTGAYANSTFARMVDGHLEIGVNAASGYGIAINDSLTSFAQAGTTAAATFNYLLGLNNLYEITPTAASAASAIQVRSDIVSNPSNIGRGYLSSTLRDPSDPATEQWYIGSGDGNGATDMAKIFERQIAFSSSGTLSATSQRLTEYAAAIIQANATSSATASDAYAFQSGLKTQLETRQGEISGVNIDEELAGLIIIQNAYAASTRVISTVNDMYDALMNSV